MARSSARNLEGAAQGQADKGWGTKAKTCPACDPDPGDRWRLPRVTTRVTRQKQAQKRQRTGLRIRNDSCVAGKIQRPGKEDTVRSFELGCWPIGNCGPGRGVTARALGNVLHQRANT